MQIYLLNIEYIYLDLYSYSYISNIASEMYIYISVGIFIVV